MTQYTTHTRSAPSITPLSAVDNFGGPLEVIVSIRKPEQSYRHWETVNVHFQIGTLEGEVGPVRVWDKLRGKRRFLPCVGLAKGTIASLEEGGSEKERLELHQPVEPPDGTWNEQRRAYKRFSLSGISGLIHDMRHDTRSDVRSDR